MIDLRELHQEQNHIANLIIETIHGEITDIPYFTYHGPCVERDSMMRGKKGLYIFTVNEEIGLTSEMILAYNNAENWNHTHVGAGFNCTKMVKLNVGDVFYLGKVSGTNESIYTRLKVHFGDRTDSATNGIKMKMPERNFVKGKLVVHTFFFDEKYCEDIRNVVDPIEKILHQKLRPVTGGSR